MPPALRAHDGQRGVGAVQDAEQVHPDRIAPLLGVGALDRAAGQHAGGVDQHVEAAEVLVGVLDERSGAPLVADVGRQRKRAPAVVLDPPGERLEGLGAPRRQRDGGPALGARQRRGLPDAR